MTRNNLTRIGVGLAVIMAVIAGLVPYAFNQRTASLEARLNPPGQATHEADFSKLTEPLETPLQVATQAVTGADPVTPGTTSVSPRDAGAPTRLQLSFTVSGAVNVDDDGNAGTDAATDGGGLLPGTGEIVVRLDDDFQVPEILSEGQITITANLVSDPPGAPPVFTRWANQVVNPQSVTVDFIGPENDEPEITLLVPDMNTRQDSGANAIADGALVTITFQQSAGIKNSSESSSFTRGSNGTRSIAVRTQAPDTNEVALPGVFIPLRIEMSSDGEPRGETLTVVALGVEGNKTATFWLDTDGDGLRDSNERDLCSVVATSADIATCDFTVANPPFLPGFGTTCTVPLSNCNFINVRDGDGRVTTGETSSVVTDAVVARQNFELQPTVNVAPAVVNVGDQVTLSLFDFPVGADVDRIRIAGINVAPATLNRTIPASGQTSFGFTIPGIAPDCIPTGTGIAATAAPCLNVGDDNPDAGIRVPTGTQRMDVFTGEATGATTDDGDQDTQIVISGAQLTVSHLEVVANQDLTISGSGFNKGSNVCIEEGSITLADIALKIDENDLDTTNCTRGILLSSDGAFTATVRVHDVAPIFDIINLALLTEGPAQLRVIDAFGAEGAIILNIPNRELSASPPVLRPGDTVTVQGRNFIAHNPDGISVSVHLEYLCGSDFFSLTVVPDEAGNFEELLPVPNGCAIPSNSTIVATIIANGDTGVVEAITHQVGSVVKVGGVATLQFRIVTAGLVTVEVSSTSFNASTTAADDGSWEIVGPPPGSYTITASAPGYLAAQAEIEISASDIEMPTIELLGGDVNGDGIVNIDDISGTVSNFLKSGPQAW